MAMTGQEIFDTVARHLFKQGHQAIGDDGMCAYRGIGGDKCAVGCLIPDEFYDPFIEGASAALLFSPLEPFNPMSAKTRELVKTNQFDSGLFENWSLLDELQNVHDQVENWDTTESMKRALELSAGMYRLSPSVLETLSFANR